MREELYKRIHPELRKEMPKFAWFMTDSLMTRENVAERRGPGLEAARKELEEEEKNGNPLFQDIAVSEKKIPGLNPEDPDVRVIILKPKAAREKLPGVVGIHGGGTIVSSPDAEQLHFMEFAKNVDCVVVMPDYRLAPENPYPAAFNDCYATLLWMYENADELGVDPERLATAGTSAGGLLSTAVALKTRDEGKIKLAAEYVGSPMIDYRNITPSAIEMDEITFPWSGPQNVLAWEMYLNGLDPVPAYASPSMAEDLSNMPPTIILCSELDPFRDETIEYASRLYKAGVATDLHIFPGFFHGGDLVGANSDITKRLNDIMHKGMFNLLHKGYF